MTQNGVNYLAKTLKWVANNLSDPSARTNYIPNKPDYSDVIRIDSGDEIEARYSFIYTENDSEYTLRE